MPTDLQSTLALLTSAGIGLLVGLERERNPLTKAGLRTFALIAVLGCLSTNVAAAVDGAWVVAVAMLVVGAALTAAYVVDPATRVDDSGTTTIVAALIVFALGSLAAGGQRQLAVAAGVSVTLILHFKAELEGFSHKLTSRDLRSMLRFAVLSAVILPLLPDRPLAPSGPLAAVSPYNVWLMVVVISGVGLAAYVTWRLTLGRHGLVVTGFLGGLVSSTATTLVAARHARQGIASPHAALTVILLANATMLVRVILVVAVVAPAALPAITAVIGPALALALPALVVRWRGAAGAGSGDDGNYRNPADLATAVGFGAAYAAVLALAAWLETFVGTRGIYGLAAVSGLTDVDAVTLSVLRLSSTGALPVSAAATAIALALAANLVAKSVLVYAAGGRTVGHGAAVGFTLPLAALVAKVVAGAL
ncbi:magnesium transporter MgtC [bacterium]|nr:MAG: magnesium transporter MgtC [bacterium]